MRSVHFGAGNIGRGFIGQILHEAGYGVTFLDVRDDVVEALKTEGRYGVILADEEGTRIPVDGVTALHSAREAEEVTEALAEADLITTAVGPSVLPMIAPAVALGLVERARRGRGPVNVIACENMIGGSRSLHGSVMQHVPEEHARAVEEISGFPNAAVDRIVPDGSSEGVDVLVEPFFEWVVDASEVRGERPDVPGITYVDDLRPYIERKLLTVNTGHSAVAYLGHARGIRTIHESLTHEAVFETASRSLEETGLLLVKEHGFDPEEHAEYRRKVLARFSNPKIPDLVTRVARAPIRKLGHDERFVSPALRLFEMGHEPRHLATVIAAVLRYDHPEDEEARELKEAVGTRGERSALALYTGIGEDHPLVDLVAGTADGERQEAAGRGTR